MRAYELMVLIDPEVDDRTVEPTLREVPRSCSLKWWNDRQG